MISRQQAEALAVEHIEALGRDVPGGVALMSESTMAKPYGWVFFFDAKRFLETGIPLEALGGNSPILVEATNGRITLLGTGTPVVESLLKFERENGL